MGIVKMLTNKSADVIGPDMDFDDILEDTLMIDTKAEQAFSGVPLAVLRAAWEEWRSNARSQAIEACRTWLASCEHFRGQDRTKPGTDAFEALMQKLKQDVRFKRLNGEPDAQKRLVVERLKAMRQQRVIGRNAIEAGDE